MITVHKFAISPDGLRLDIDIETTDTIDLITFYNYDDPSIVYRYTPSVPANDIQIGFLLANIGLKATMVYGSIHTIESEDSTEATAIVACSHLGDMYHSLVDRLMELTSNNSLMYNSPSFTARREDIMMIHSLMYAHTQALYLERFNDAAAHYSSLVNEYKRLRV